MKLLIDHDSNLYKGLWATVDQGYFAGLRACDNIIYNILDRFNNPPFELVITGPGNFRKKVDPKYKANRKPESRPKYLYDAKEYYKRYWGAVETVGVEADDYIASNITDDCIIVSEDHDFKQLGVKMFNPRKWEITEITNPEYHWWMQCLTGCTTDNVKGLTNPEKLHHKKPPSFTEETASKLLVDKSPEEMSQIVQELYKTIHGDNWFREFDKTARLLWLKRSPDDEYHFHLP